MNRNRVAVASQTDDGAATQKPGLWDLRTAAKYLAMSEAFMRKHVRQGTIPFLRVGAKSVRFRRESLDEWLAGNSVGSQQS